MDIQPIEMVRGTTRPIRITLTAPGGGAYILQDDDIVRFGVKRAYYDTVPLICKELSAADQDENGVCTLVLRPADTLQIPAGTYFYDVGVQTGEDYHMPIKKSPFTLTENITSYEVAK